MELKLVVAKGEPKGKAITVSKSPTVVGREPGCELVIASPKVSRKHCQIDIAGNSVSLTDLGSGNGTFVNGKKVEKVALNAGDRVVIGPLGFVVQIDGKVGAGGSAAASAPAGGDINDFLASLEHGSPAAAEDNDVIQLSEDDLTGDNKKKKK